MSFCTSSVCFTAVLPPALPGFSGTIRQEVVVAGFLSHINWGLVMVRGQSNGANVGKKVRLFIKYSTDAAKSSQVHRMNF